MSTGVARGSLLAWLVLLAGLMHPGSLRAQTPEERLSALEARLSRLERNLELLVQKVAGASPLDPQAVKELKDATQPLANEPQQLQTADVPQLEPARRQFSQARLFLRPLPPDRRPRFRNSERALRRLHGNPLESRRLEPDDL